MTQARSWCFTVNNPEGDCPLTAGEGHVRYAVWQLERGERGTYHWQGYAEFDRPVRLAHLKGLLPTAHWERRRGSPDEARNYAMKEDSRQAGPWETGTFGGEQGKRTDLALACETLKAGGLKRVAEEHPTTFVKFHRGFQALADITSNPTPMADGTYNLKLWQLCLLEKLRDPPNDRTIYWVVDKEGGNGKTWFCKFLVRNHQAIVLGGKSMDILYGYRGQKIALFDYPRESEEWVNYGAMEKVKDGIWFSGKYESGMKTCETPHVVGLSNFMPDLKKFSLDRWKILVINSKRELDWDWIRQDQLSNL